MPTRAVWVGSSRCASENSTPGVPVRARSIKGFGSGAGRREDLRALRVERDPGPGEPLPGGRVILAVSGRALLEVGRARYLKKRLLGRAELFPDRSLVHAPQRLQGSNAARRVGDLGELLRGVLLL